jgi:uncharacterized protein YbbK (DUF523 family)
VGVSACLVGQAVRYDGTAKPHDWIMTVLSQRVELVPLCPEAGAGLGVPRPPVMLVQMEGEVRARGVSEPGLDVTQALLDWSRQWLADCRGLDAVILKSRSPSCGLRSTPLYDSTGRRLTSTAGIFARRLQARLPELLLVEETSLETEAGRERFLRSLGL